MMYLTGRIDFAICASVEIARRGGTVPLRDVARAQDLPTDYVRSAMRDLRRAGIVSSRRGHDGGYALARSAADVSLADIVRAVGATPRSRGERQYRGAAAPLADVWQHLDSLEWGLLASVTLADVIAGDVPPRGDHFLTEAITP